MKIAFIGIGNVGFAIADNLHKSGHRIIIGNNRPNSKSVISAKEHHPEWVVKSVQDAVNEAEVIFLGIPFQSIKDALVGVNFYNKPLVDCTNPVGPGLTHGLKSEHSGAEEVQQLAPDARVVKAFTIYGYENFVDSTFPKYNSKPVMLIAGDDLASKEKVTPLIEELGFLVKDTGALSQSLHLEHMTLLWVKMVRMHGNPNFVWGYFEK